MFTVLGSAQTSAPVVGGTCIQPNTGHPTHGLVLGAAAPHAVRVSHASDEQRPPKRGACLRGAAEKTLLCPSIMPTHFHTILLCRVTLQGLVGKEPPCTHTMHLPYLQGLGLLPDSCLGAKQTWEHVQTL